jgi:hypothetical protein
VIALDLYSKSSDFQRTIEVSTVEAAAPQRGVTLVNTRYQASRVTVCSPDPFHCDTRIDCPLSIDEFLCCKASIFPMHLMLILPQLVLGLSTSTVLFSMVLALIVNSRSTSAKVDGLGILQVLWLFKQHPEAQEIIAHVDHPTVDNLRSAGMAEIWLGEE